MQESSELLFVSDVVFISISQFEAPFISGHHLLVVVAVIRLRILYKTQIEQKII